MPPLNRFHVIDPRVVARRTGLRMTTRSPSTMSGHIGCPLVGRGPGSGVRIHHRHAAETANEIASARIAAEAENAWTSAPARPGPPACAAERLSSSRALASMSLEDETRPGMQAVYATPN